MSKPTTRSGKRSDARKAETMRRKHVRTVKYATVPA